MKKVIFLVVECGICGISIGWLTGLSTSPLLQGILTSIMAVLVGLIMVVSGLSQTTGNPTTTDFLTRLGSINFVGLSSFLITFAIGASIGLYARTNELLGINPNNFASKWKSTIYTEEDIKKKMFDKIYSKDSLSEKKSTDLSSTLYGISVSQCAELSKIEGYQALLAELKTFEETDVRIKKFLQVSTDSASIFALRQIICP